MAGRMLSTRQSTDKIFLDAGVIIGALSEGDTRHSESFPIIESAYKGEINAFTSVGVLSEVYGALTWVGGNPQHSPVAATTAIKRLLERPSNIKVVNADLSVGLKTLELATKHGLTARRTHDAKHAAAAIIAGIEKVFTYDVNDWTVFQSDGIVIAGPPSSLIRLSAKTQKTNDK